VNKTLVDKLRQVSLNHPDFLQFTFKKNNTETTLSAKELDLSARRIAATLSTHVFKGDRAILLYPSGLEFISALFGCFYAGVIAVPIYSHQFQATKLADRIMAVMQDTGSTLILTLDEVVQKKQEYIQIVPGLEKAFFLSTDLNDGSLLLDEPSAIDPRSIAFLQYSSGSTGTPKGIMVSHENLMANLQIIRDAFHLEPNGSILSWLPLYHDMGLIGNVLGSVFSQSHLYLLSPFEFTRKPICWLQWLSKTKARASGGPNFGYDLCIRSITEKQCEGLDLSSWTVAYNGAEAIRESTLRVFAEKFAPYGFDKSAFLPCYGLAEATLMVTGSKLDRGLSDGKGMSLVSSGSLVEGQDVAIVDPDMLSRCENGSIGEIWVSGLSVCKGYWNRPEQTQATFHASLPNDPRQFLRTGDLGFLDDNRRLYVTGRMKDLIILRGQNHHPEDIEWTVMNSHPLLQHRRAAAFSIERGNQEKLVILISQPKDLREHTEEVIRSVHKQVSEKHELSIHDLVFVKTSFPVTSSGKIQRHACKRLYLNRELETMTPAPIPARQNLSDLPTDLRFALVLQRLQQMIAQEMQLPIEKINLLDPLHAVDSLSKVRLQHLVQELWGVSIQAFSDISVVQLAREIANKVATISQPSSFHPVPESYPLTHSQESLYFMHQLIQEKSAYTISRAAKSIRPLDRVALEHAFTQLVERHASLRTAFFEQDGKLFQRVLPGTKATVLVSDARALTEGEFSKRFEQDANKPFDLDSGLLIRLSLYIRENEQILLLSVHHIIADFWSLSTLFRDLADVYSGEAPAAASLQPFHYVLEEERFLQSVEAQEMRSKWQQELLPLAPPLDLPTDFPRPVIKSYRGSTLSFQTPSDLSEKVHRFAREKGTTPYVVLLTAYVSLLHRYTEKSSVFVGSPMANRTSSQFASLVSYLVNPIIFRADFTPETTFLDLLEQMKAKNDFAQANQRYPLSKILEDLAIKRDGSTTPLFQAMFSYLNPMAGNDLGGFALSQTGSTLQHKLLALQSVPVKMHGAQFDLNVGVSVIGNQIAATWEYSTDLFKEETILRMAAHFEQVLEKMVCSPHQAVDRFALLTDRERNLMTAWNETAVNYENDQVLHHLFENQAFKTPGRIAVRDHSQSFTYETFNRRANQLAHYLRKAGVGPQAIVGVQLHRSIDLVTALYAILKTGASYLPIAPDYPQSHIDWIKESAQPRLIITESTMKNEQIGEMPEENLQVPVDPRSIAYIIYTSGSTGRPKGVMIPHQGITNRILWMQEEYQLTQHDRVLQKTPYTFDVSVWEFFWPLATGASLFVCKPEGHKDPDYLIATIKDEEITTLHFVPSMLKPFLDNPKSAGCTSIKRIFCSGEALPKNTVQQCIERLSANLYNLYGPTEASVDVSQWHCPKENIPHTIPIGFPIANMQLYILDRFMQQTPIGVHGELYIGGIGLALGYINQPQLTSERFVPNPFLNDPQAKLYKTGDRCRYQPNGAIEFLGRIDTQVKIRGFRIELEEVEIALRKHPHVSDAVALALSDDSGAARLAVYYISRGPTTDLKLFMSQQVPEYMVPALFIPLEDFPMLSSGKVDHKALAAIRPEQHDSQREYVKAETELEQLICSAYEEVLGLKQVGINDNFFELGGDSILVLRAVARIRCLGREVTVQQLYSNLSIREVATHIQNQNVEKSTALERFALIHPTDVPRLDHSLEDVYPLSKMQEGLVFHSEFSPDYETYVMGMHVTIRLDQTCLLEALHRLSSRHALLRTSFDFMNYSEPLQLVHSRAEIPVQFFEIAHLSTEDQNKEIEQFMREEKWRKFIWTDAPFFRIAVHKRGSESHQFTFSHPLFDGWSMGLLITEFFTLYGALLKGTEPQIQPKTTLSYRDFVALERKTMQSDASIRYWKETLLGMELSELPRLPSHRKPRPGSHTRVTVEVDSSTLVGLQQLSKIAEVPFKSVLLAAHLRVVALLTGRTDVATGLLTNGRPEQMEADRIAGMFLNTLPFRMELGGGNWINLVQEVLKKESSMLPHRRFPLSELVRTMGNGKQLFETAFNYIHFHIYKTLENIPGLSVKDWKSPSDQTYFPLTAYFHLDISQNSNKLLFFLDIDQAVLAEQQIQALPHYYLNTLRAMANNPYADYRHPSLLFAEEKHQVTQEWNQTRRGKQESLPFIHDLISFQAASRGDKIAIACNGEQLSYRKLEERSNCLAHELIARGIKPNTPVAVCLERSVNLVVALVAVMKAGGAYIPVDPTYPKERLGAMLDAVVVISHTSTDLPLGSFELIHLDTDWPAILQRSSLNPNVQLNPEDLAYIIYTSGSTGLPKGVEIPHRALSNFISSIQRVVDWSSEEVLLAVTTVSFDIAGLELYLPLTTGAQVVLATREMTLDGFLLAETLVTANITVMQATPATWRMLLSIGWTGSAGLKALCGGESFPSDLAKDLLARGSIVWNLYGPTETTIWSTAHRIEIEEDLIPIGRPIDNTKIYILDAWGHPVAVGVIGELFIGGFGLAKGYRNRTDLTAERFIVHPQFNRLYRTGDLARYRPDGVIECMGRVDHQVKVRGFRIELGEIETHLSRLPGMERVIAWLSNDGKGDARIVAHYMAKQNFTASELRAYLEEKLPLYMIPSAFMALEDFPLTPNGKIDRKALPEPKEFSRPQKAYVAPSNDLERKIAEIYAQILKVESLSIDDNFFDLGGHSLLLVKIHGKLQELLSCKFPLIKLFEYPTVRKLASFFETKKSTHTNNTPQRSYLRHQHWIEKQKQRRK
jgi:amino acid adenylation domain-containing protein